MSTSRLEAIAVVRSTCCLLCLLTLSGCGTFAGREETQPPIPPVDVEAVPDALPRPEPLSKYGNPVFYEALGRRYYVMRSARGFVERGIASWYGPDFHGKRTSSGERYDMYQMTAAHKTLPIPCYVEVTNLQNGRRAVLKVNDRGPFKDNRVIDLSYVAARKLGIWQHGTGLVELRVIDPAHPIVPSTPAPSIRVAAAAQWLAPPTMASANQTPPQSEPTLPFFLQLGAFFDRTNAERLRDRVLEVVREVRVSPAESNGQAVYRVQVGPLTSIETSDRIVQTLHGIGINDHRVVLD